jgi:type I restriction enzyme, S subunit
MARRRGRYKSSILTAAFSGVFRGGTEGWSSARIDEIATVGTGATPKRGEPRYYVGGNIPWVTSGAVADRTVTSAEEFITPSALAETNCKIFPRGTLLMAMYGEGLTRGKVARLEIAAATNQALAAIQLRDERVTPDFLFWYLHSQYLELRERASGGVQPNLNLSMIKAVHIPYPSANQQAEIVRRIETAFAWIDRLAGEAQSARKLIHRLDQAILSKAFRGELVSQDPNDEPASVLLERIRAERNGQAGGRKRRARV